MSPPETEYKTNYSVYKYQGAQLVKGPNGSGRKEFPTVWEALNWCRRWWNRVHPVSKKKFGDIFPDTQFIISEYTGPYQYKIICVVSQQEIMQEKFSYKLEEVLKKF